MYSTLLLQILPRKINFLSITINFHYRETIIIDPESHFEILINF